MVGASISPRSLYFVNIISRANIPKWDKGISCPYFHILYAHKLLCIIITSLRHCCQIVGKKIEEIEKASGKVLNSAAMNIIERGKEEVMEKLDKAEKELNRSGF